MKIAILKVQAIVANQYALACNEALKFTPFYKKRVKQTLNPAVKELIKLEESEFLPIQDEQEEALFFTYDVVESFLQVLTGVLMRCVRIGTSRYGELIHVLQAFEKNPQAMVKQANYINKEKI